MGARMKKPLWVLFFFIAYIVIRGGIEFVFKMNLWNLGRQADMWELIVTIICVGILVFCMYKVHTKLFKPTVKRKIQLMDLIFVFVTYITLRFSIYLISLWSSMAYGTGRSKLVDFFFRADLTLTTDKFIFAIDALGLVFIAPLIEEFLFRGFLNNLLRGKVNTFVRMSIVSILFAAIHFPTYIHNWIEFLAYLILSIVLFLVYERRRSLFDAILLHSLYNGLLVILFIEIPRRFF
ncbi:CPBP family intramembrane glutamic endopeptidase [Granulicatella adiacens]|uniref:CPBP family intramembrane glutamic endopeptidase n=1 Tax=Granulicatella adiacens TaxID=46124 RepID=UPI0021A53327|nr:type II CAAX endopeptidase family protein [Granulicatella adiacens]MCT2161292.1 CPBP family intramembrane metalloprotease [Granulicatella adiacens]